MKRKAISKKDRLEVLKKYNNHCAYCGCELDIKSLRIDHLIPLHNGGSDNIDNYMPACHSCNFYKSTLTLEKFRNQLKSIHLRIVKYFIVRIGIQYNVIKVAPFDGKFYFEKME